MASDLSDLAELFPSLRSLLWFLAGLAVGLGLHHFLEPWRFAAWVGCIAGFAVMIGGLAWQTRRQKE